LPHYRFVRVRETSGARRVVEMSAWRDCFPLWWVAEQTSDPERPHIAFRHIAGPTRGMEVEWIFTPLDERTTRVTILHRVQFAFPVAAPWLERHVVNDYFIHGVASKTLARFKRLAEASAG
jgi:ribosome-associated toxin RatA of RatAB toxin-antitoxin module